LKLIEPPLSWLHRAGGRLIPSLRPSTLLRDRGRRRLSPVGGPAYLPFRHASLFVVDFGGPTMFARTDVMRALPRHVIRDSIQIAKIRTSESGSLSGDE
jgi:hypothetical protein